MAAPTTIDTHPLRESKEGGRKEGRKEGREKGESWSIGNVSGPPSKDAGPPAAILIRTLSLNALGRAFSGAIISIEVD